MWVNLLNIPLHCFPVMKKHNFFFFYFDLCCENWPRVHFLLGNNPFHHGGEDNTEEGQYAHTLCFFLLPQTETSLGLLRKAVTHSPNEKQAYYI